MVFSRALGQVRRDIIIVEHFKMVYLKKTRQCTVNAVRRILEVMGGKSAVPISEDYLVTILTCGDRACLVSDYAISCSFSA